MDSGLGSIGKIGCTCCGVYYDLGETDEEATATIDKFWDNHSHNYNRIREAVMAKLSRKYVVFKVEDWDDYTQYQHSDGTEKTTWEELQAKEVEDAVVLRKQDVFTSSALYEYAGQIRTAIEIIKQMWGTYGSQESFIAAMEELAASFTEEAEDAETHYARKVPD